MTIPRTYALTVKRPWAWAIIYGGKNIENRSRAITPCTLLIHAGAGWDPDAEEVILRITGRKALPKAAYQGGVIIGQVTMTEASWSPRPANPWAEPNCWHWHLTEPQPAMSPISCRGYPSLWHPPSGWETHFRRGVRK